MSKISVMAVSLLAAVPAGFLSTFLVITFFNRAEVMTVPFYILAGGGLALSALITVLPIGILLFGAKSEPVPVGARSGQTADDVAEAESAEFDVADADDFEMADAEISDDELGVAEFGDDDFESEALEDEFA